MFASQLERAQHHFDHTKRQPNANGFQKTPSGPRNELELVNSRNERLKELNLNGSLEGRRVRAARLAPQAAADSLRAKLSQVGQLDSFLQRSLGKLVLVAKSKCLGQLASGTQAAARPNSSVGGGTHNGGLGSRPQALELPALKRALSLNPSRLGVAKQQLAPATTGARQPHQRRSLRAQPITRSSSARANSTQSFLATAATKKNSTTQATKTKGKAVAAALLQFRTNNANTKQETQQQQQQQQSGQLSAKKLVRTLWQESPLCNKRRATSAAVKANKGERARKQSGGSGSGASSKSSQRAIVSLLSSAAAARRCQKRAGAHCGSAGKLLLLTGALLLLLLLAITGHAAPIGRITSGGGLIRPIWLGDGLMTVSDSSSLEDSNAIGGGGAAALPQLPAPQMLFNRGNSDREDGLQEGDEGQAGANNIDIEPIALNPLTSGGNEQLEFVDLLERLPSRVGLQHQLEQQLDLQQRHSRRAEPKRSWFSLSAKVPTAQVSARPPVSLAKPNEFFWIERRRLNRDRALEPPAWMRDRPIRRDNSLDLAYAHERDDEPQQQKMRFRNKQQQLDEALNRPIRPRFVRGRQMAGESAGLGGELYGEVLRHLVEALLEGGATMDDFYAQLEPADKPSRAKSLAAASLEHQLAGSAAANAKLGAPGESQQQQLVTQPLAGSQQAEEALLELAGGGGKQMESGNVGGESQQDQGGADQTLVVAGDEISAGDEVELPSVLEVPNTANIQQLPANQQRAQQQPQQPGQQQQPVLAVAQKLTQMPLELLRQQADDFVALQAAHRQREPAGDFQAASSLLPGDNTDAPAHFSYQTNQMQQPADETHSFHVIEDIDQVDSGRELPIANNAGQQQEASSSDLGGAGGGQQQAIQFVSDQLDGGWQLETPGTSFVGKDKRSVELPAGTPAPLEETQTREEQQTLGALAAETLPQAFERRPEVASEPFEAAVSMARDERSPSKSRPAANTTVKPPLATAIEMIQAGFFTRAQLIQFATKLRIYLENSLQLPRGAILGLFPINTKQLLVELDLNLLRANERNNLIQNYGYVRDSSSLVLNWPSGLDNRKQTAGDNPLPILMAILDALYDGEVEQQRKAAGANEQQADSSTAGADLTAEASEAPAASSETPVEQQTQQRRRQEPTEASSSSNIFWPVGGGSAAAMTRRPRPQLGGNPQAPPAAGLLLSGERKFNWMAGDPLGRAQLEFEVGELQPPLDVDPSQQPQANWIYVQQQQRQVPLAAYLSSLYNLGAQESIELARSRQRPQAAGPLPLTTREQLLENLSLLSGRQLALLRAQQAATKSSTRTPQDAGLLHGLLGGIFVPSSPQARWFDSPGSFFVMLSLALVSTCLIVKLMMRKLAAVGSRRSHKYRANEDEDDLERARPHKAAGAFWSLKQHARRSSSIGSEAGECGSMARSTSGDLIGAASGKSLGETPAVSNARLLCKRKQLANSAHNLSTDSGHETIGTSDSGRESLGGGGASGKSRAAPRNSLQESLAQRWARFVGASKPPPSYDELEHDGLTGGDVEAAQQAVKRHCSEQTAGERSCRTAGEPSEATTAQAAKGTFRTSTSYIRSLIEALTKATGSQQQRDTTKSGALVDDEREELSSESASSSTCLIAPKEVASTNNNIKQRQQESGEEILMSQMDISAAHLILDYMEKHLIDKERLRREWLELNADNQKQQQQSAKANLLVLQRLAKVALADENRHKNRNALMVPFDRNRVRLGAGARQTLGGKKAAKGASRTNDYINASFIYDDDPRRPTHIVAQGPSEATCAQFWQMIWEQEISVVVMLTRLNENGEQMCHCYWPADLAATSTQTSGQTTTTTTTTSSGSHSPPTPPAGVHASGQRGSVTSVFSGQQHSQASHQQNQGQLAAIVAGGEPNDSNVLVFEVPLGGAARPAAAATSAADESGATSKQPTEALVTRLEVHLISEHVSSSDYLVRNMCLLNRTTGETRTLSQFHYLAWPAGRTPESVRNFLQFRRKVHKSYRKPTSPILVHCNDGAGRAGTYTLIDMTLERIKNGAKEIDLRATLEHLREQRLGLCATQAQFEFVLVALAEEIQIILNALPQ